MEDNYNTFTLLTVIFLASMSTLIAELINYFLVYKKDEYQSLVANIKTLNKKLDKVNESLTGITKTQEKKKLMLEESIKMKNTELMFKKFKSTFIVGLLSIVSISYFSNYFSGIVLLKLPFVSWGIFQGITHRNIEGEDYSQAGFLFVYILSSMVIRSNVQKIFGLEGPQTNFNPFAQPQQ